MNVQSGTLEQAQAELTAAEQAAVIRTHYVKVFVSTTALRQTVGARVSETDWAPEVEQAFKMAGKVGGFFLVSPKFLQPFDSHRKAAQRSRDAFGTDYEMDGGKVYLIPEKRVGEVKESVQKFIDRFEMWKESDDPETGLNVLVSAEMDARAKFDAYADVLEAKLASDKFDQAFQRWLGPRGEAHEQRMLDQAVADREARPELGKTVFEISMNPDPALQEERRAFFGTEEGYAALMDAQALARAQVAPMRERITAQMVSVEEMRATRIQVWFTELELKDPEGFGDSATVELLRSRNQLAERMAREIPAKVAERLAEAFQVALKQEGVNNLPETAREKLRRARQFAIDNNFNNDPLVARGIQAAYDAQIGSATRKEVEAVYRALSLQQRMYEQKAKALTEAAEAASLAPSAETNQEGLVFGDYDVDAATFATVTKNPRSAAVAL